MTDEQLAAITTRAQAAVEAANAASVLAENEYASTMEHAEAFERDRAELTAVVDALLAEVKRLREALNDARQIVRELRGEG